MDNTNYVVNTADDEEPDCLRCDYVSDGSEAFCKQCGECGWAHYERTVVNE